MVLSITYDLHNPGQDYARVHRHIADTAGSGRYFHAEGSVWFVDTLLQTRQWQEALAKITDTNDEIIVAQLVQNLYWGDSPQKVNLNAWFNSPSRRW